MTDPTAVPQDDGVDRAEVGGVLGELVEQRGDRPFEGVRDVEAVETEALGPVQQGRQVVRAEPEHLGVDEPVAECEAVLLPLPFLHGRSEGPRDPRAHQAQHE